MTNRAGRGRAIRAPLPLALVAGLVVAALLLPLAYLVIRVAGGGRAIEILGEPATWRLVWNTVRLAAGVVVASVLVGVPVAWLVTRTDLPGRRFWGTAAAVPLVIPSYVAAFCLLGFFGERGLLAEALGIDGLPDVRGYWGSLAALTLATYPYVFLLAQATLRGLDPALEEAAGGLGASRRSVLVRVTAPALRPAVGLGSLLVALYTLSDFGVVTLMGYDTLTRAIYVQYGSLFDRAPAATLALVLVGLTAVAVVAESRLRRKGRLYRAGPGSQRDGVVVPLGRWTVPALAFCTSVVGAVPRPTGRSARLLARARDCKRAAARHPLERGDQLPRCVGPRRGVRGARCGARRRSRASISVAGNPRPGTSVLCRECIAWSGHRALARLLRRPVRDARVPDARAPGVSRTSSASSPRGCRESRRRSKE